MSPSKQSTRIPLTVTAVSVIGVVLLSLWWLGNDTSVSEAQAQIDETRAANVSVVLRVELLPLEGRGGSKYHWPTVRILNVLKNDSQEQFSEKLNLAHLGGGPGIPSGESTIYLVRYNESHPEYGWKLDETRDGSKPGFTHNTSLYVT